MNMTQLQNLQVSFVFIAACAASLFFFSVWIGPLRGRLGVLRGSGGDETLFKRTRIHGNFIENAPLMAMVLMTAEILGAHQTWLWLAVASFFVGRVYHYVRYDRKDRGVGMALTTAPAMLLGGYVLVAVMAV
jgi:uncharacterized membrane protein YecN with MAPEG domain